MTEDTNNYKDGSNASDTLVDRKRDQADRGIDAVPNAENSREELEQLSSRINKQLEQVEEVGEWEAEKEEHKAGTDERSGDSDKVKKGGPSVSNWVKKRTLKKINKKGEEEDKGGPNMTEIGLRLIKQSINELFVDQFDNPFAAIKVAYSRRQHIETIPVNKNKFKRWVLKLIYDHIGVAPNDQALTTICDILNAEASFSNNIKTLDLRVSNGHTDGMDIANSTIYYDLTNIDWQVVKITQEGWSIEESSNVPVMFRRYSNQQPQVRPSKDYPPDIFDRFMNLINIRIKDKEGKEDIEKTNRIKLLLKCYIVSLFIPNIPKPALMLHGEQGAAKTTCQELIKKTVDPSSVLTLVFPGSTVELIQQLSHNYISYFDNKSIISEWVSDQLCRAVTGTGFSKRKLYSDDDDIICHFMRGIGFNGISLAASKADLLDRGIILELSYIDEKDRRLIKEVWTEFEQIRPQLLGYIFDVLSRVLRVKSNVGIELKSRSRMADFEEYGEIIGRCMGYQEGVFVEAYRENRKVQTDAALEVKPVARAIIHFMQSKEIWTGTTTELLGQLEPSAIKLKINIQREKLWPKAPHILSRRLAEVKTNLRQVGILINESKDPKSRLKSIEIRVIASEASEASEASKLHSKESKSPDATQSTTKYNNKVASDKNSENNAQNGGIERYECYERYYPDLFKSYLGHGIPICCDQREQQPQYNEAQMANSCEYCRIIDGNGNIYPFDSSDLYLRHVVKRHKGWTARPGPADIEKFKRELNEKEHKK